MDLILLLNLFEKVFPQVQRIPWYFCPYCSEPLTESETSTFFLPLQERHWKLVTSGGYLQVGGLPRGINIPIFNQTESFDYLDALLTRLI